MSLEILKTDAPPFEHVPSSFTGASGVVYQFGVQATPACCARCQQLLGYGQHLSWSGSEFGTTGVYHWCRDCCGAHCSSTPDQTAFLSWLRERLREQVICP